MSIPHPKGGSVVSTCVKDNIIKEKEQYEAIRIHGFDYKLFEEEEGGGGQELLYRYPYLNHLIQLWPGGWFKHMGEMNESVGMKNRLDMFMPT